MSNAKNCNHINWSKVSNFWEVFEEMGISPFTIRGFCKHLKSPVLVVGAGLGIVPECLCRMGYNVKSLDCTKEMAKKAKARRNLEMTICNATRTPFKDHSFGTVLINTGVVDTLNLRTDFIPRILQESKRLLRARGKVIVSFFREKPHMEFIYECLNLNKVSSNYSLFMEKNLAGVKLRFVNETEINRNLIDFIFKEYADQLERLHDMVLKIGKVLKSKDIEPEGFIAKYLGYEKFDFNKEQEEYLSHVVKKIFGNSIEKKLLCDNETCIIVAVKR